MAQLSRAALKAFFNTGDIPTEAQFADLIDSLLNIIDDITDDQGIINIAELAITSPQILALNTTPLDFIADPGAGKAIVLLDLYVRVLFGTTPYATQTSIRAITDTANVLQHQVTGVLASSGNTILKANSLPFFAAGSIQAVPNKKVTIDVPTADPTGGDGTIVVWAPYQIINTP